MNTLATITNENAVPRSKSVLRSTMPRTIVTTQIVQPVIRSNGRRHALATIHPAASPMRNGAAIREHLAETRALVVVAAADGDEHDDDGDVERGRDADACGRSRHPSAAKPPRVPLKNSSGCGPSPSWSASASRATTWPSTKR